MTMKYTYWMTEPETHRVRETMENLGIHVFEAKKAVCVSLSKKVKLSIVDPTAWSSFDICKRQLSWYGVSEYNGLFLVVSDKALTAYGIVAEPATIITESDFKPDSLPGKDPSIIARLSQHPIFVRKCPEAFNDIDGMDPVQQDRWMKIMGVRGISYEDLFVIHCANHSNFIDPEFYTQTPDGIAPYSIGKTNRSCSACLQFFNIIGKEFKTKYVVPCPGAVVFAGLKVNRYYKVTTPESSPKKMVTNPPKKADVYILTGFLGSGKTTLLQRILSLDTDLSNTLVVVNEFGAIGVDGSLIKQTAASNMVELASGCICCTLKIDLIQTMNNLGRQFSPTRVFVEATGVADPAAILSAFDDPLIKDRYQVVKTITVLDADFWEAREAFGQVFENQLASADLILLNKVDLMEKHEIASVLDEVHEAANGARVVPTVYCTIDPEMVFCHAPSTPILQDMGAMLKPYDVSTDITHTYIQADAPVTPEANTGSARYVSFSFEHDSPMDKHQFDRFLEKLPLNLFRVKGMVQFQETAAMLNYVGGKADWIPGQEVSPTRLAFIGWDIDTKVFKEKLTACIAISSDHPKIMRKYNA